MTVNYDTERGWPRPIMDGFPVPWVAARDDLGDIDSIKDAEVRRYRLCQVCGLGHEPGAEVISFVNESPESDHIVGQVVQAMDNAILHRRCAKLAFGRCPALLRLRGLEHLTVVVASVEDVLNGRIVDDAVDLDQVHPEGATQLFLSRWEKTTL